VSQPAAVARVVDAAARSGVAIEIVTFDQSTKTAVDAARAVGAQVGQIVKSLVFVEAATAVEAYLALVSGANRVDLQRLAEALAVAAVRRATADEAYAATCFAIGGIPPFGHCKLVRTVMDPDLLDFETVWAAAGTGNTVFEIAPPTLRDLAGATVVAVAEIAGEVGAR
jgi:prolyl-tRNA editing enzyme YbaK/EbsC (Cys-tRNA(Pro) deacylase)